MPSNAEIAVYGAIGMLVFDYADMMGVFAPLEDRAKYWWMVSAGKGAVLAFGICYLVQGNPLGV